MTIPRFDLIVAGELNADLILSGDVIPAFGQVEKLVDGADLTVGSSSAIFACGAARLGLKVAFIGKVGRDVFGRFMIQSLAERGIDTRGVIEDSNIQTGLSVILNRGSDRAILTYPGSIPLLRFSHIPADLVAAGRHLHLASYFLQTALRPDAAALFDLAHASGLTTSLDTNYDPAETWDGGLGELLKRTDIFLPNEAECLAIARTDQLEGAIETFAHQVKILVVKLGKRGAVLRQNDWVCQVPSLSVQVVDTVGAGDSFDAGFIYGFLTGWDPERALRLGSICGSLSTCQAGGTTAQPTLAEALRFF